MSQQIAETAINSAGVKLANEKFTFSDVVRGMRVEREHGAWGTREGLPSSLNVVGVDEAATANIALAHLLEKRDGEHQYDYYDALEIVEEAPAGIFRGRQQYYWLFARIAFIIIIVIMLAALFSMNERPITSWVILLLCVGVLVLKADVRGYIV